MCVSCCRSLKFWYWQKEGIAKFLYLETVRICTQFDCFHAIRILGVERNRLDSCDLVRFSCEHGDELSCAERSLVSEEGICCVELITRHAWVLCTGQLKCDGTRAETRFRLSAKRTSPFKSAGASVQSTAGSRGVRISGSNGGCTMFRGSVKGTGYPLHSPVSPSLPLPCVTVCQHISTGLYLSQQGWRRFVFRDVMTWGLVNKHRRFGEIYCLFVSWSLHKFFQ